MVVYTAVLSCKYLNTSVQMQCLFVALSVSADLHVHVHRRVIYGVHFVKDVNG